MSLTSYRAAPPRDKGLASDNCDDGARRFGGPGGDLLFHALRRSTIGAEGFHGRVRDGIGCFAPRYGHQAGQTAESAREPSERLRERHPRTRVARSGDLPTPGDALTGIAGGSELCGVSYLGGGLPPLSDT